MSNISPNTKKLIERYKIWRDSIKPKEGVVTISVDDVTSKVAKFYEKIREIVDWREKHLMRRMAIERVLKRRLFLKPNSHGSAEPLILELIRAGHFPNNKIPKTKINEIQKVLDKYTYIINKSPNPPSGRNRGQLYVYLISIAACEVEETLDPPFYMKEAFLVDFMEKEMAKRITIGRNAKARKDLDEKEKEIQIYIAVQQALLKLDSPIITYNLIKRYYKKWLNYKPEELADIAKDIYKLWDRTENSLGHPLADKFYKICEKYDTTYLLVGDVLTEHVSNPSAIFSQPDKLNEEIKKHYKNRLKTLKSRLARTAFYSTLSIFLSNIFTLYFLEIPFAKYVMGNINIFAAVFDVVGPTFLMFLLVVSIRTPGKKNEELVLKEINKIVYFGETKEVYEVELYPKRSVVFKALSNTLYFITFCITFGLIILILYQFNYPPLSYVLLIMFTSLIAYTGLKIRQRSRELDITERRGSVLNIFIDPFAIPIVRLGKWISARWEKINIVGVLFIFLIDTPFLVFVEFLEQWRYFIKEKKEDIR